MGRYQWGLFVLCGMGWVADNLWLQVHQEVLLLVQFLNLVG